MATPFGSDDGSATWVNKIGQSTTISARVTWVEENGSFVSVPTVTQSYTGGLTFCVFWATSEIVSRYRNGDHECVQLRVKFGGQFKYLFVFKIAVAEITKDYTICADGSGQIRPM